MKKLGTWIVVLLLIAGAIGGYVWWRQRATQEEDQPDVLRTAEVARGDLEITVSASGNVAVEERIDLTFTGQGDVTTIDVAVNERVETGQELARLETTDLERAVRQAEIALEQAEINLSLLTQATDPAEVELARLAYQSAAQTLEAMRLGKQTTGADANQMVVQAQRTRENAFKHYQTVQGTDQEERAREAYENAEEQERIARLNADLMTEQAQDQWLAAYQRYEQARRNLDVLEAGADENRVRQSELQVEQARLSLQQARENLADAVLTAPFAGLITAINAQEGLAPPSRDPAITLIDDSTLYVEVSVDEIDIGRIAEGQAVAITLDAYPEAALAGVVDIIAPSATNIGGIIAYRLRVRITETDGAEVRDGMTASVVIQTDRIEGVLLIPNWAVKTDQESGETYAYCYCISEEGTPRRTVITLGQRNDTYTEVLSGLEEGATVALIPEERNLFDFDGPPSRGQ